MLDAVKKLREATGAGVMDCQKALEDAGGDFDKAVGIIRKKGFMKAEKRSGRETGTGLVHSYVHNGRIGVLIEIRTETDFVAHSDPFKELAHDLAMQLAAVDAQTLEEFLEQPYIKDESRKVKDLVAEVISKVGENVKVGKFYRIEI